MEKEDIRRYSLEELKDRRKRGLTKTRKDAPEVELDDDFWKNARVVMPGEHGKIWSACGLIKTCWNGSRRKAKTI